MLSALALAADSSSAPGLSPLSWWAALPFIMMLLAIAICPMVAEAWWARHRNKAMVALTLGLPTALYMGMSHQSLVLHTLHDYLSFCVLLAALYCISGGIVLRGDIEATPQTNTLFLAAGAVLANLIGTTGAAMLLIRPVLRTNQQRERTWHIPVFFIFIVANTGGLLTPLGDPPLFLGYLRGVPFGWTLRLWPIWLTAVGLELLVFYLCDRRAYAQETGISLARDRSERRPLRLAGAANLLPLACVVGAVFVASPWREVIMLAAMGVSFGNTPGVLRQENQFSLHPIAEIVVLFAGIFLTMMPALELLRLHGGQFGLSQPWQFFWLTGLLSSFLDNAPTYVSFVSLAQGLGGANEVIGVSHRMLMAISAGAVLMGANSYIGNGPNFMVKAIADASGFRTPSFLGYMGVAAVVLLPLFVFVSVVFLR